MLNFRNLQFMCRVILLRCAENFTEIGQQAADRVMAQNNF